MESLFAEALPTMPKPVHAGGPEPITYWIVVSWYAPDRRWKMWPELWTTQEKAEKWAIGALATIRGHTHYSVIALRLGYKKVDP